MSLHIYIPQDRLRALAYGKTLPDRTNGAALFADISGFTALTEALRERLGTRQGAEELTKQLGAVYSALIAEVEKYGGSVISFAGDAIMCWFDRQTTDDEPSTMVMGQSSAVHAVASAFGMQTAIQAFPALGLKVAVTFGDARRFVVGDPEIQRMDVLVGGTVERTSTAEHHARKGEVLVDEATAKELGVSVLVQEWRHDKESGERFAVASKYAGSAAQVKPESVEALSPEELKSWVPRAVFERETSSPEIFLTQFRPCVALFVRFTGIDYDSDSAESEVDAFIRQAQRTASHYGGALMDVAIGDKGSYAYVNFGALSTHEDDARRAVKTAMELIKTSSLSLQVGITQGVMRVGAYGGETRKSFGALGDDVNLAARLMTTAGQGEILLSGHVHKVVMNQFTFEPRALVALKGKAEPVPVFAVTSERKQRAIRLQEPNYALPMVGRQEELQRIDEIFELVRQSKSQVIAIVAEAGIGKSRLVAEVIRLAHKQGFVGYGGACQADAINTPYLAWKSIWQAFFDVDPAAPLRKQMRTLEGEIEDRAPDRVQALPLLNVVLDVDIPENDFTRNLEPQHRKSALHALLEDCLKSAAQEEPTLVVVEDLQWVDPLAHDLLEELAKALVHVPICFVLAYRPPQLARLQAPRLEALPQFTRIELHELNRLEAEQAIRAKLAQLYPARGGAVPIQLVDKLMNRTQGNPFYLEELLNYLRDRGLDPRDASNLEKIELPDTLHALVLSRIDQLTEHEKLTLRTASIIGRLFRVQWLTGYYPALGDKPQVKGELDQLAELEIIPLDTPEPELAYLFKHIVTHEVTYESLSFDLRARLHEQLAEYLEGIGAPVDAIAHHYGQTHHQAKQREYWQKAGTAAQEAFANEAALDYFTKLLPLLTDPQEQIDLLLKRGDVLLVIARWTDAEEDYQAALTLAEGSQNALARVRCQRALGMQENYHGNLLAARQWLEQAVAGAEALGDTLLAAQCVLDLATVEYYLGDTARYARVQARLELALPHARQGGDLKTVAQILVRLAYEPLFRRAEYDLARPLLEEAVALSRQLGDRSFLAEILSRYALLFTEQVQYSAAQIVYTELFGLAREMGDLPRTSETCINAGYQAINQGRLAYGRSLLEQALLIARGINFKGADHRDIR